MRDFLLAAAVLIFILLGFPAMKRLDRFLNAQFKEECEASKTKNARGGK